MKKLITSSISDTVGMPVKSGTWDFLQAAYQEALTALANNLIGARSDTTRFFILYGCKNTGVYPNYNISAGAIYYAGEVYLVPAAVFTATGGKVAVANFTTAYYTTNADPVLFTDGVQRNVHQIKTLTFTAATAGSGVVDYSALIFTQIQLLTLVTASMPAAYTCTFDQDRSEFFSAAPSDVTISFDFTNAIPGAVVRLKWAFGAGRVLSINQGVGQAIIKDSGNLANVASATNIIYFLYCGKNESGADEVSYTLKQV